jgi:hypothetical protein
MKAKVSIHRTSLSATPGGSDMQLIATVYVQSEEYRVQAPSAAHGPAIEWLDQVSVVYTSRDSIGGGDVDAPTPIGILVRKLVKQELEKSLQSANSSAGSNSYYHVRLHVSKFPPVEVKFDLSRSDLETRVLKPYQNLQAIVLGGRTVLIENIQRLEIFETPFPSSKFPPMSADLARQGTHEWYYGMPEIKDVTDQFVTTPAVSAIPQNMDAIELLCERFHAVVKQLRKRRQSRATIDVQDEYDVQDLLHALLRIFFDDVRPEEWTPSFAGKSSRMDFLLPKEKTVVEIKKARPTLTAGELGTELIDDAARYKSHPSCKRLVCFVYDPEGYIANPTGIEADLSRPIDGLEVKIIIMPR